MIDLSHAIRVAKAADDQFDAACKAAGYKSRWDAGVDTDPLVKPAKAAKIAADDVVRAGFAENRARARRAQDILWAAEDRGLLGAAATARDIRDGRDPTGGMVPIDTQIEALARHVGLA